MLVKPEVKKLLINSGEPPKPAVSETVFIWIKDELPCAGVNISLYKAHVDRSVFQKGKGYRDFYMRHTNIRSSWKMRLCLRLYIL